MNSIRRGFEFLWLVPRNAVIIFILVWRKLISPLYGDVCRYHPSCSAYGLAAFQQRGAVIGTMVTAWRILRCNPWSNGGVDPVKPGSNHFKVLGSQLVAPR